MTTFQPVPKPSRARRKEREKHSHTTLQKHRRVQYELARGRDDGLCAFCYFLYHKRTPAVDVHHVYGRGKRTNSWREFYGNMLCTCRKCHPQPIYGGPGTSEKLAYVEQVLTQANTTPIYPRFKHAPFTHRKT